MGRAQSRQALGIIIMVVAIALSPFLAQQPAAAGSPEPRTLKERLGEKWSDDQRVDNCRVPLDKRGPRPRPDSCPNPPPAAATRP
jgi:hypothetical protein